MGNSNVRVPMDVVELSLIQKRGAGFLIFLLYMIIIFFIIFPVIDKCTNIYSNRFRLCTLCSDESGSIAIIFPDHEITKIIDKTVIDLHANCADVCSILFALLIVVH